MPVAVSQIELAATFGADVKRVYARQNVAREFFQKHMFDVDKEPDYRMVRRAMQVIDFSQPIVIGSPPAPPQRLVAVAATGGLGGGFFREMPAPGTVPEYWLIAPDALHLKFVSPSIWAKAGDAGKVGELRLFVPGVRNPKGKRAATRDRS